MKRLIGICILGIIIGLSSGCAGSRVNHKSDLNKEIEYINSLHSEQVKENEKMFEDIKENVRRSNIEAIIECNKQGFTNEDRYLHPLYPKTDCSLCKVTPEQLEVLRNEYQKLDSKIKDRKKQKTTKEQKSIFDSRYKPIINEVTKGGK